MSPETLHPAGESCVMGPGGDVCLTRVNSAFCAAPRVCNAARYKFGLKVRSLSLDASTRPARVRFVQMAKPVYILVFPDVSLILVATATAKAGHA